MPSTRSLALLTAAALALGHAAPVAAASRHRAPAAAREIGPPPQKAPYLACTPLCEQDYAPCDPPYFKHADNRCFRFRE